MYTVLFNSCRAPVEIANWLNGELALGNKFIACNGDFYIFEAVEHLRAADAARVCACKQPQKQYYLRCGVCGGEIPPRP